LGPPRQSTKNSISRLLPEKVSNPTTALKSHHRDLSEHQTPRAGQTNRNQRTAKASCSRKPWCAVVACTLVARVFSYSERRFINWCIKQNGVVSLWFGLFAVCPEWMVLTRMSKRCFLSKMCKIPSSLFFMSFALHSAWQRDLRKAKFQGDIP
jgi:hypothetical protein